jgi:hypothetical protein
MSYETERAKILEMIQQGSISAEQALQLLNAIQETGDIDSNGYAELDEGFDLADEPLPPHIDIEPEIIGSTAAVRSAREVSADIRKWKSWWKFPFWAGTGVTTLGGILMFFAYQANGFSFWFACSLFLFLIGAGTMALFWASRNAPWLHIRVNTGQDDFPRRIALSFPLPIRLTVWFVRTFKSRIPNLDATGLDEIIIALKDSITPDEPLFIDVNDEDDGESVQVYIG